VFCSESPLPHSRQTTDFRSIRPQLSAWSDVTYTCSWFRMPLTSDTVRVIERSCTGVPPSNAGFTWFWINCRYPISNIGYALTDAHSSRYANTLNGQIRWPNVNFGSTGTVRVVRTSPEPSFAAVRVYCGDFNSGTQMTVTNGGITIAKGSGGSPQEYVCRWFRYDDTPTSDDNLQIPSVLTVNVQACPPGFDHNANMSELFNQCTGAVDPVEVGMVYPFGMLAVSTTTGSSPAVVEFGLIGQGWGTVIPELPNDSRVFCTAEDGKTYEHSNGVNTSVNIGFTWGRDWSCTWFVFADS
jgi:hypothetical protein